ncbi:MAG: 16S rRNA processing protein RimM, partial [Candidatus Neomarinimicrobiota bacterium]
ASEDGQVIGDVAAAWDLPANDVLQVIDDGREVLIPLVSEVVLEIDHASRRLVIAVMEGLLN